MTPKRLLGLWRERWDKTQSGEPDRPYAKGKIHKWLYRLPRSSIWDLPGTALLALAFSLSFLFFVVQLELTLNGQISLGLGLVGLAVIARRFEGRLFALTVLSLAVVACGQYFYWRYTKTLVSRSHSEMFASMAIATLESCWVAYVLLHTVNRLWPIEADEPRPTNAPTARLDVIARVGDLDETEALRHLEQCLNLEYPANLRRLIIVDPLEREAISEFAELHGALRIPNSQRLEALDDSSANAPGPETSQAMPTQLPSLLERAIRAGSGELILVTDARHPLPANLLRRVLGWFSPNSGLALLYTDGHDLDPRRKPESLAQRRRSKSASGLTADTGLTNPDVSFALFERAAWDSAIERSRGAAASRRLLAIRGSTHELGACLRDRSALVMSRAETVVPESANAAASSAAAQPRLVRIDRADSARLLRWKGWLVSMETMLHFYRSIAVVCVLVLPPLALLLEVHIVHVRSNWTLPMALPYLALLAIAHERSRPHSRWGFFYAIREAYLAVHMTLLTAWSFARESIRHPRRFLERSLGQPLNPTRSMAAALTGLCLVFNLAAILAGLYQQAPYIHGARAFANTGTWLLILLAFINLALLLARQAALHEADHIRWYVEHTRRLPATLVLPSGHTLACTTVNFPERELVLKLPCKLEASIDEPLMLQIRHDRSPFNLTVHATRVEGEKLFIKTDGSSEALFVSLKEAVFSRNSKWPAWFPHKNRDRLLPPFISEWLVKLVDLLSKIGSLLKFSQLRKLVLK